MTYIENIDYKYNLTSNGKSGQAQDKGKMVEEKTSTDPGTSAPVALLKTPKLVDVLYLV